MDVTLTARGWRHGSREEQLKTFERYKQLVNVNIVPQIGDLKLSKIQPIQIAEFDTWTLKSGRRRKPGGLSLRTVLHIHRMLRKALKQAVLWQIRATNPVDAVEVPRPEQTEIEALSEDRVADLLAASQNSELFLPILIAVCTGMRPGEVLALERDRSGASQADGPAIY